MPSFISFVMNFIFSQLDKSKPSLNLSNPQGERGYALIVVLLHRLALGSVGLIFSGHYRRQSFIKTVRGFLLMFHPVQ